MKIILGIDIGSTSTKIIGINQASEIVGKAKAKTGNRLISMYGAMGKLLHEQGLTYSDVEKIALTGAGSSWIDADEIHGIKVLKVSETAAVGAGALALSGLSEALVMNIGTGTVFVHADGADAKHVGGSGLGGATLVGLAGKMIGENNVKKISELGSKGDLKKIDLMIGDVYNRSFSFLPAEASAANFGKFANDASNADIALGLLSMIYQVLGTMAVFAGRGCGEVPILVTGALAELAQAEQILPLVGGLYGANFVFCENPMYTTAYGAALEAKKIRGD